MKTIDRMNETSAAETAVPLTVLTGFLGAIYRCKGIVHAVDSPDRRGVLQVVGRRVDITLEEPWGERPSRTRIVAIGMPGKVAPEERCALFEDCLASRSTACRACERSGSNHRNHESEAFPQRKICPLYSEIILTITGRLCEGTFMNWDPTFRGLA